MTKIRIERTPYHLPITITRHPPGRSTASIERLATLAAVLAPGVLCIEYDFVVYGMNSVIKEYSDCFRFVGEIVVIYDGI